MKTLQPRLLPPNATRDPEALIKEARRRQRRRRLTVAAVVVALAAGATAFASGLSGTGSRPRVVRHDTSPRPLAPATTLVTVSRTRLPGGSLQLASGFGKIWGDWNRFHLRGQPAERTDRNESCHSWHVPRRMR